MKVYAFLVRAIGTLEALSDEDQFVLNAAAIVHDIGIKISGCNMEVLPQNIRNLRGLAVVPPDAPHTGGSRSDCKRFGWLIAHHHTYQEFEKHCPSNIN